MNLSACTHCMIVGFMCMFCICTHFIFVRANIHAGCLVSSPGCDTDMPQPIYAVSYASMIANTMRERERFNTAFREALTKCLPFSTKTELVLLNEVLPTQFLPIAKTFFSLSFNSKIQILLFATECAS